MTQNIEQQIYNNTVNYDNIVSEFVKGITFKKGVKRVNFFTFNMEGSFLDRFIPFMEKDNYLNRKLIEKRVKFNLVQADNICFNESNLKLLLSNKENLSIIVVDTIDKPVSKNDLKTLSFYKKLKINMLNLNNNLKIVTELDSNVMVYVVGIPYIETETLRMINIVTKLTNGIYKYILKKYSNVTYVETKVISNKVSTAYGFGQMAYLLSKINETLVVNQINKSEVKNKFSVVNKMKKQNQLQTRVILTN